MTYTRRDFLRTTSTATAVGMLQHIAGSELFAAMGSSVPLRPMLLPQNNPFRALCVGAVAAATNAGASFAEVRITSGRSRDSYMDDLTNPSMSVSTQLQASVRVMVDGAWGFTASTTVNADELARIANVAVNQARTNPFGRARRIDLAPCAIAKDGAWETPIEIDPFTKTIEDQLLVQTRAHEMALSLKRTGIEMNVYSTFGFSRIDRHFASSEGAYNVQRYWSLFGDFYIDSWTDKDGWGETQPELFRTGHYGWEVLTHPGFMESVRTAAEESVALALLTSSASSSSPTDPGRYDIVFDGRAMAAPLGVSIGRALQMDRALGYQMTGPVNQSGGSYLSPPDKILGKFSYGSPLLTVSGTRTRTQTPGLVKWDEEGVEPIDGHVFVRKGVVEDYMTSREFAARLDWWYKQRNVATRSNGCSTAANAAVAPVVKDPTLLMEPADSQVTVDALIAGVRRGIFISGPSGVIVDPSLLHIEIHAASAVEIRDGKLGQSLGDAAVQVRTVDFWKAMDAIGGASTVRPAGYAPGKPGEGRVALCPAARFRQLSVINVGRTG